MLRKLTKKKKKKKKKKKNRRKCVGGERKKIFLAKMIKGKRREKDRAWTLVIEVNFTMDLSCVNSSYQHLNIIGNKSGKNSGVLLLFEGF